MHNLYNIKPTDHVVLVFNYNSLAEHPLISPISVRNVLFLSTNKHLNGNV